MRKRQIFEKMGVAAYDYREEITSIINVILDKGINELNAFMVYFSDFGITLTDKYKREISFEILCRRTPDRFIRDGNLSWPGAYVDNNGNLIITTIRLLLFLPTAYELKMSMNQAKDNIKISLRILIYHEFNHAAEILNRASKNEVIKHIYDYDYVNFVYMFIRDKRIRTIDDLRFYTEKGDGQYIFDDNINIDKLEKLFYMLYCWFDPSELNAHIGQAYGELVSMNEDNQFQTFSENIINDLLLYKELQELKDFRKEITTQDILMLKQFFYEPYRNYSDTKFNKYFQRYIDNIIRDVPDRLKKVVKLYNQTIEQAILDTKTAGDTRIMDNYMYGFTQEYKYLNESCYRFNNSFSFDDLRIYPVELVNESDL